LGTWQGSKEGRTGYWLRWWNSTAEILPWAVEQIEVERQRADREREEKENLITLLRDRGIDPNGIV
jgi:hypothetical protein